MHKTRSATINFTPHATGGRFRRRPKKVWSTVAYLIGAMIIILALLAAYYYPKAKSAYSSAQQAVAIAKKLPTTLSQQNFTVAKKQVDQLQTEIDIVNKKINSMGGLKYWPYVGRQYQAIKDLATVGNDGTGAMKTLIDFLAEIFAPFSGRGKVNLASITPEEKGKLLAGISQRGDELKMAQEKINAAAIILDRIPDHGLLPVLQKNIKPLKEQFPLIAQGLNQAIPATKIFPSILGYPKTKNYLFLMENNMELRPGGGFIGTYGKMRVVSGEIASLSTDNVYNLDNAAEKLPRIEPPWPLVKFLKSKSWFFRDSNWSPDFPTSAQQALNFYQREGGSANMDGVIAITPTAIAELLRLVGPITVSGIEFTADNFIDRLQYQVEKGFLRAGLSDADRKDIIGVLTSELVMRLMNLPLPEWKDLFLTMTKELNEKQILMFMRDEAVQSTMVNQNWAGAINASDVDYLMVVDANLASLKTDQVMERTYTYQLDYQADGPIATLTINYKNTGNFDWKTTRYNTYVRVYVPAGSKILETSGAQTREKSNAPGEVETTSELGRTVFAAYKSVEPQTNSNLMIKYRLPKVMAEKWKQSGYTLVWQKQPGMLTPAISLAIKSWGDAAATVDGLDNLARVKQDTVTFTGRLSQDRQINIKY